MKIHNDLDALDARTLFEKVSVHDLRAIATRLGVRTRGQQRKADWVAAITAFWQSPAARDPLLAAPSRNGI